MTFKKLLVTSLFIVSSFVTNADSWEKAYYFYSIRSYDSLQLVLAKLDSVEQPWAWHYYKSYDKQANSRIYLNFVLEEGPIAWQFLFLSVFSNYFYYKNHQLDSAEYYLNQSYELLQQHQLDSSYWSDYYYDVYKISKLTNGEALFEAIRLAEKFDIPENAPIFFHQKRLQLLQEIGMYFYRQGLYDKAIPYLKKSLFAAQTLNDYYLQSLATTNLAACYYRLDDAEQTANYLKKAIQINQQIQLFEPTDYSNLAALYFEQAQCDSAFYFMEQMKESIEKSFDKRLYKYRLGVYYKNLGIFYTQDNCEQNLDLAIPLLLKAEQIAQSDSSTFRYASLPEIYQLLVEIYETKKAYEKALEVHKRYKTVEDSIHQQQLTDKIAKLDIRYQSQKKEQQITLLEEESQYQRLQNYSLIIGLLLLALLAYIFFRARNKQQAANALIANYNLEIEAKNQQLQVNNQTKEKLLAIIAHDLNAPMNTFKGTFDLIKLMGVEGISKEDLFQYLFAIEEEFETVVSLINNLLYWALNQQNAIAFSPEHININTFLEEQEKLIKPIASHKSISFSTSISDVSLSVYTDINMLKFIIRNLLHNAIKFTPQKGEVTLMVLQDGNAVQFVIQDEGVGIPSEKLPELFELIGSDKSREDSLGKKGTGLGLAVSKDFAEKMNGRIWVKSTLGKGTTFYLEI